MLQHTEMINCTSFLKKYFIKDYQLASLLYIRQWHVIKPVKSYYDDTHSGFHIWTSSMNTAHARVIYYIRNINLQWKQSEINRHLPDYVLAREIDTLKVLHQFSDISLVSLAMWNWFLGKIKRQTLTW